MHFRYYVAVEPVSMALFRLQQEGTPMTPFEVQMIRALNSIDKSLKIMSGRSNSEQSVARERPSEPEKPRRSLSELGDELL
jgi:hypothetical protein